LKKVTQLAILAFSLSTLHSTAQEEPPHPVVHQFALWGQMKNDLEKLDLYLGFTNGFFAGPRSQNFVSLLNCLEKLSADQAIAMVDKYYKENPQRWSEPLAYGIAEGLTVPDGPCRNLNPYR